MMLTKYVTFFAAHSDPMISCLNQWHRCWIPVSTPDGDSFPLPTAEHYMMWRKAMLFKDYETAEAIVAVKQPSVAKNLGRQVKGFDQTIWDREKYGIVVEGNRLKFEPECLRDLLLATGEATLIECNPKDPVWSCGLSEGDPRIRFPNKWPGQNLLGKALMEVRDYYGR